MFTGGPAETSESTLHVQDHCTSLLNVAATLKTIASQLNSRLNKFEGVLERHTSGLDVANKTNTSRRDTVQSRSELDVLQNTTDEYSKEMRELIVKVRYNVRKLRCFAFEIYCAKDQLELGLITWYVFVHSIGRARKQDAHAVLQEIRSSEKSE